MIPITIVRVHITSPKILDLGDNPGSSLRGAIYEALGRAYDDGSAALSYKDDRNLVAWLMRMEDASGSGGKDSARPFALRPPTPSVGTQMAFDVAFYGNGIKALPMVLSAIAMAGTIGIGRGRGYYTIDRVEVLDPLTRDCTPFLSPYQIAQLPDPYPLTAYTQLAARLNPSRLTVHFKTPMRIIRGEKLCFEPVFRAWGQRLLERIRQLSELYDAALWIPFAPLLTQADAVRLTDWRGKWVESRSWSSHKKRYTPTSGFIGTAVYEGDISAWLPYLLVGQAIQVGKNTVKGFGWYELEYAPR